MGAGQWPDALDEDQYRALDFEPDYQLATGSSNGAASGGAHPSMWSGPARPGGQREWKKTDRGDGWWDPLGGSTKASAVPNNFSPGM
jgi:hypothetical protein